MYIKLKQGLDEQNKKFCFGMDCAYLSFATTVSQLKICDVSEEKLLKVLKCYNFP
jgi:hypothetical protein